MKQNEEFYIEKDGIKLHAKLNFPKTQKEKMPLVILIHGLTGHMEEEHLLRITDAVNGIGIAVLRVEMYGHGMSDGEFKNHNVMEWVSEAVYVIDYAKKLPWVSDLYLSGHSQGGLTTILAAAIKRDALKAIMPLSPAICIRYDSEAGNFFGTPFSWDNIPEELAFWEDKVISSNYLRVARMLPVEESIAAFDKPVLLVHGGEDETVPVAYSIDAAKKYRDAELVVIDGDLHCYDYHVDKVCDAVTAFLLKMEG